MASNGRLPSSELVEVHQPLTKHNYLAKAKGAAAANNTLWMAGQHHMGIDFYSAGQNSDYRSYDMQVYFWNLYISGRGNLAAKPGTSNHGWGLAKDIFARRMLAVVRAFGADVGLRKIEAPSEWWHYNFVGFARPDPGLDIGNPIAARGSGGRAQAWYVKRLQEHLIRHGYKLSADGDFGPATEKHVKAFQASRKLKADGVVGAGTWRYLRRAATKPPPDEQPTPPPVTPVNPIAEDRKIIAVLEKYDMVDPATILAEARRAKIPVRLAAGLLNLETGGGFNVWGHDRPPNGDTSRLGGEKVTKAAYQHYLTHRGSKGQGGMQGVGPCQLTWYSFQDEADRLGGCWVPKYNMRVGFTHLGVLVRQYGMRDGSRRYNGSGSAAEAYAGRMIDQYELCTKRMKEGGAM